MQLYEIDAYWENPLILTGQFEDYEVIFNDHKGVHQAFLKNGGFDAVFYTPHYLGRGIRQIALLKPKDQVLAIRRVPDLEIDWKTIKRQKEDQNRGWDEIMLKRKSAKCL
jgi:hypothetical protein